MYIHRHNQSPTHRDERGSLHRPWTVIVYFAVFLIYMELMLKLLSGDGLAFSFFPIILSLPFALIFSFVCSIFSERANLYIARGITIALTVLFLTQYIYRYVFKTYMSFYSVTVGVGQAMGFMSTILSALARNILPILLFILPVIFIFAFGRRFLDFEKLELRGVVIRLALAVMVFFITFLVLFLSDKSMYSAYDLYFNTNQINSSVHRLGLITTARLDIKRTLFGFEEKALDFQALAEASAVSEVEVAPTADPEDGEAVPEVTPSPEPEIDTSPNVLNVDFDTLIAEAPNDNVKSLHEYFRAATPTNKNEYTGMFEGYNLIMLTAEAFSHMAVSEELTPTLYKMLNTGFVFEDFYTPIWGVSTSDGEYVATTGLVPKDGVWSFKTSGEQGNNMLFTMGAQFARLGYTDLAYHNHTFDYYGRDLSHPNMGYTYKGLYNGLDVEVVWPESDLEMMEKTVPDWIDSEHFHAYYMTVSGHMNYSFDGNMMSARHQSEVEHLELSNEAKAYIACNLEVERALTYLVDKLEEAGKLSNTLFVLSADHYPYGLEKNAIDELSGHEVEENFELYKNTAIIWSASMEEPIVVSKPSCSMDIIPTISNLLALPYDSRMLMGTDVMSDTTPLIIFNDSSFIKGDLMYNANTNTYTSTEGKEYSEEALNALRTELANKVRVSAAILDTNYYQYIEKYMDSTAD